MPARCFHCGGEPVGVCARCNALVCIDDGTRPKVFRCRSCGSSQTAANAIGYSALTERNPLSRAIAEEGDVVRGEALRSIDQLLFAGYAIPTTPGGRVFEAPTEVRHRVETLVGDIARGPVERGPDLSPNAQAIDTRLPASLISGVASGRDAVLQALEIWNHLDSEAKRTLAAAILSHQSSLPATWGAVPALTVLRYALEPNAAQLPTVR